MTEVTSPLPLLSAALCGLWRRSGNTNRYAHVFIHESMCFRCLSLSLHHTQAHLDLCTFKIKDKITDCGTCRLFIGCVILRSVNVEFNCLFLRTTGSQSRDIRTEKYRSCGVIKTVSVDLKLVLFTSSAPSDESESKVRQSVKTQ